MTSNRAGNSKRFVHLYQGGAVFACGLYIPLKATNCREQTSIKQ
jgi:hypothetical protein